MAVSEPVVEFVSNADASSYTHTSSFTPAANSVILIFVTATACTLSAPTISGGSGWSIAPDIEANCTFNSGVSSIYAFIGVAGASPGSFTCTFDCTGDPATGCTMSFLQFTGANTTTPLAQFKIKNSTASTNPSITADSNLQTGNAYALCVANPANPAGITETTNWTETVDTGHTSPTTGVFVQYRDGGESGATVTTTRAGSVNHGIILIEIAAGSADKTVNPSALSCIASVLTPANPVTHLAGVLSATATAQAAIPLVTHLAAVLSALGSLPGVTLKIDTVQSVGVLSVTSSLPGMVPVVIHAPAALSALSSVLALLPKVDVFPLALEAVASLENPGIQTGGNATVLPGVLEVDSAVIALLPYVLKEVSAITATANPIAPVPTIAVPVSALSALSSAVGPIFSLSVSPAVLSAIASLQAETPQVTLSPSALASIASTIQPGAYEVIALVSVLEIDANVLSPTIEADFQEDIPIRTGTANPRSFEESGRPRIYAVISRTREFVSLGKNRR